MSAPAVTLRIDTSGTAFGAAATWTDRTTYLMAGEQYAASINWGRQDERSDPDAATCSFYLKNDTGFWTPGNAAAPANWDIGCPVNLQITANGTTYDRFTGYVDAIEPTWPGGVQSWSVVKVTATDAIARLGLANGLRSLLQYEMLADSPLYFYTLGEGAGSVASADISGNGKKPAVRYDYTGGAYVCSFGTDMGMFDGGGGVNFGSEQPAADSASSLSICRNGENVLPAASGHTQICWFISPGSIPSTSAALLWTSDLQKNTRAALTVNAPNGALNYTISDNAGTNFGVATSNKSVCDAGLHMVAVTLESDRRTVKMYLDGVLQTGVAVAAGAISLAELRVNEIGAITIPSVGNLAGTISHVAAYGSALSAARILAIYQAGAGSGSERSDLRFARIAGYGGITTSGLPTGSATSGGQKTSGKPAVESLRVVARSEGGPMYATKAGAVTFQSRGARYNATATTIAASEIGVDLAVRRDRQGLVNSVTVSNQAGSDQIITDSGSQTEYGRFDGGSFEVALSSDDDALALGQWEIATGKSPQTRLPSLMVDLYRNSSASFVASILALDISSKIQVTGLPSQAPASTFTGFIEGATETISYARWSMGFFTSPVTLEDSVFTLEDATKGQLDSTYVLAF